MYSNFAPRQSGFAVCELAANRKSKIALNRGAGQLAQSWLAMGLVSKNAFKPARSLLASRAQAGSPVSAGQIGWLLFLAADWRPGARRKGIGILCEIV
jgi:hypothetical protein